MLKKRKPTVQEKCNHIVGVIEPKVNLLEGTPKVILVSKSEMVRKHFLYDENHFQLSLWQYCPTCKATLFKIGPPSKMQKQFLENLEALLK